MDCVCPPPLCCSAIGETPKKQQFLRRRVKKQLNRLLTKLNLSVTHVTPPLYLALQNTGEEFQIPTPKRYVIIRCSKYRYSHFKKNKGGMWNVLWCCESRGIECVALNSLLSLWNFEGILLFPCAAKWIGECPPGKGVKPSIENLMKSFLTSLQREQERSIR